MRGAALARTAAVPAADRLLLRVRGAWRRAVLLRALVAALALAAAAVALLLVVDLALPLPPAARRVLRWTPALAGLLPLALAARRLLPGPDDRRLALLVEERYPELESTLSTALEALRDGPVARAFRARAEARLDTVDATGAAPLRIGQPAALLGAAAVTTLLLLALAPGGPAGAWQRWALLADARDSAVATGVAGATSEDGARSLPVPAGLTELRVRIQPPAYSGLSAHDWEGGDVLAALPGSRVLVRGATGGDARVRAQVIGGPGLGERDQRRWALEWTLAAAQRGLSLEVLAGDRLVGRTVIPLAALPDHPPGVELDAPSEDVVAAAPRGTIPLRARALDDYGVADFHVSWIRSRGSGESFSFEEGVWEWERVGREEKAVRGELALDLAALQLEPGDVLHVRAVARDGNTVGGPGEGVSPTRVIRIATPDQMAEVTTLSGLPIEAARDPVLTQRMVILLTERLLARAPRLPADSLVREAETIADEQARLRARIGDQAMAPAGDAEEVHADSHDHDANPIISVNGPLMEAYNAMWSAEGRLRIAELRESLPYQYQALRIIQEARQAERVFLRGRQEVAPVDVAAARGTGELDDALPAPRIPAPSAATAERWLAELEGMQARLSTLQPQPAAVALSGLAARLLADPGVDASAAARVVQAAEAARQGQTAAAAGHLLRARALLGPGAAAAGGEPAPAGAYDPASAAYFRALGAQPR